MQLQDDLPSLGHLICVRGPDYNQAGHGAHMSELLDGLMRGSVLADSNRVMGKDVDDRDLHERTQAERAAHVIDEDEESRPERPDFYQAHSVEDGAHRMLADAKVKIAAGKIPRGEVARTLKCQTGLG